MAAAEPSQENIDNVIVFTGEQLSLPQAVNLLKKYNNNVDSAIGAYFDNPDVALAVDRPDTSWQSMDNTPPTFRIDAGGDDTSIRAAASRPNSRASNRQTAIDLTPEHTAAGTVGPDDDNDPELQKALALSRGELSEQEAGIINSAGQQFGPARRSNYDTNQWAMTTTSTNTREIIEHPPASKRRRTHDEPVFLRGSPETAYLPTLLTIYHSIPLAREALRFPPLKVHTYGYDPLWWAGTSDENHKSVSVDSETMLDHSSSNFLTEVQQLMGFLDGTNRAYGSADALAGLHYYQQRQYENEFLRFLDRWKNAAMHASPGEQLTQVFTTVALKQVDEDREPDSKSLECLECPVSPKEDGESLYEILDRTIYTKSLMEPVWIDAIGEVVTIRLFNADRPGKVLNVKPPAVWYPDRYLEYCRGQSFDMRQRMHECVQSWNTLNKLQQKCQQVTMSDGRLQVVQDAVTTAISAIEKTVSTENATPNGVAYDMPAVSQADANVLNADLQRMLARIDQKVALLEERKNELVELKRKIGQEMTRPSDNPFEPPHKKYVLQGVGTKTGIVYVRRPVIEDLVDLEDDEKNAAAEEDERGSRWQWWRISWNKEDHIAQQAATKPHHLPGPLVGPVSQQEAMSSQFTSINGNITKADWAPETDALMADAEAPDVVAIGHSITKVKEYEVLRAARDETDSVCLVYANENAMNFNPSPFSPALRQWVMQDNGSFEQELIAEVDRREIENDEEARRAQAMIDWDRLHQRSSESEDIQEGTFTEVNLCMDGTQMNGDPPPYDEADASGEYQRLEMREKPKAPVLGGSRVGMHADNMLERMESRQSAEVTGASSEGDGPMHIEHAKESLR